MSEFTGGFQCGADISGSMYGVKALTAEAIVTTLPRCLLLPVLPLNNFGADKELVRVRLTAF